MGISDKAGSHWVDYEGDMTACQVTIRNLSHSYGDDEPLRVLDDISLDVQPGQFVSIVGPSGCGKSTLLRAIGGLLTPTSGEVMVDEQTPRQLQQKMGIGFVFQDPALLPWRSVRKNIDLPLEVAGGRTRRAGRKAVRELLDLVGLREFSSYPPYQLSGGMQQRVAIARALAFDPPLLLMDEPFGALDEITREAMRQELQRIWAAARKTVFFVTHSIREAALLSDRVIVLSPRPARVLGSFEVTLPRPRTEQTEDDPEFLACIGTLREALRLAA
ncbi:MAG: ABC transporter ATP-binding protein [Dehalococcoidia bacterium]